MIINNCRKIVGGTGEGRTLVTSKPLNFLAMVDAKTGKITDPKHELYEKSLRGKVLVFPYAIGSSVGAYVFYSLKEYDAAPVAILSEKADITTASGCAIANIPLIDLPINSHPIPDGAIAKVEADLGRLTVRV